MNTTRVFSDDGFGCCLQHAIGKEFRGIQFRSLPSNHIWLLQASILWVACLLCGKKLLVTRVTNDSAGGNQAAQQVRALWSNAFVVSDGLQILNGACNCPQLHIWATKPFMERFREGLGDSAEFISCNTNIVVA
jgi:hypothetical protein